MGIMAVGVEWRWVGWWLIDSSRPMREEEEKGFSWSK